MEDIFAEDFIRLRQENPNIQIIDVREKLEFHTFNIGGTNIPLGDLPNAIKEDDLDIDPNKTIIVICQKGLRSKTAKVILQNAGFRKAKNLIGGLIKLQSVS
ncbi:rhodanese-like domain-containing protein [Pedobacter sp. SD-b]|uniref:Rhodanese-like domain-containing protein n=1 Tax=Pedobacter segetis TaxID=2793069 RepID=A0ABS1BI25_9SPHI|nr:rhodanese-like domain-containing protein [Pedobacter segetis]MBK0381849.1 rhodanese-like domain-containing protein [Pedobacter segetis]